MSTDLAQRTTGRALGPPRQGLSLAVFSEGWGFVLASRVLPATFFLMVVMAKIGELRSFVGHAQATSSTRAAVTFYAALSYRIAVIVFLLVAVTLFVIRLRPVTKATGVWPGLMAIVGSFMMTLVAMFPQDPASLVQTTTAALMILAGTGFAAASLLVLGRSFSLMPEARKLVTAGPYAVVRHPMYLGEALGSAGMVLQSLSLLTVLVYAGFLWVQVQRMSYEEGVLQEAFPEYAAYRRKTAKLIPKVY